MYMIVYCWTFYSFYRAYLVAQMVKYLPAVWETWVPSLGREDPLKKGMNVFMPVLMF